MNEEGVKRFAEEFILLVNRKNGHIKRLQKEVKLLKAINSMLQKKSEKLTVDEIRDSERPVWVVSKTKPYGFYAFVDWDKNAVKSSSGGIYTFVNYDKTWIAYTDKTEDTDILIDTDIAKDEEYFSFIKGKRKI